MELSKRLQAVASLVTAGYTLADIGTDHAYIPIYLVEQGKNASALAMDVNEGPLLKAKENIHSHGLSDLIETRLSNGFSALNCGEAESAVIAGMGGGLVIRILQEGQQVVASLRECILQPQSEMDKVRAFLLKEGFFFIEEDMVEEDGKYYPMMKVIPGKSKSTETWDEVELCYGKILLEKQNPTLKKYLEREIKIRREILSRIQDQDTDNIRIRKQQLLHELEIAEKGMDYYAV